MKNSKRSPVGFRLLLPALVFFLCQALVGAIPTSGQLSGLIISENGQPLSRVLVSLLQMSSAETLPNLAKTDIEGRVLVKGLEAGVYRVDIKSAEYRSPVRRLVQIVPNRTTVITLILQQLFRFTDSDADNVSLKALLRASDQKRLIFRNSPFETAGMGESSPKRIFDDAVIQVFSNSGLGGDYFVFPGDSWAGTSTNFAVTDSVGGRGSYIFAGQLNSGHDSIWRIKNLVDWELSEAHSLRLFLSYGRMSYQQPGLALLNNPETLAQNADYARADSTTQLLSFGVEDTFSLGSAVTLSWGLEADRLRSGQDRMFFSPNASLDYSPTESTHLRFGLASQCPTLGNTINLPDGQRVSLASPVLLSRVNNRLRAGTARYYFGSVTQSLDPDTTVELAYFDNRYTGEVFPVLAIMELQNHSDVWDLPGPVGGSRGYRATIRRSLVDRITGQLSVIRAQAPGLLDAELFADSSPSGLTPYLERRVFHSIVTQVDAKIPATRTRITALFKVVPGRDPLVTLDPLADVYETGNEGISLFIRQIIPLPSGFLSFLGLEFLTPESIEALLDIRNLLDGDLGMIQTADGTVALVQNPRSLRGGLSVRF